jgi:hypothetical protein
MSTHVDCALLAVVALCLGSPSVAAGESVSQFPVLTKEGENNLTHIWLHRGGGRLYWNTLVAPRQILLEGAHFVDPASVPELVTATPPKKGDASTRRSRRRTRQSKPSAPVAVSPAPKDAGKTALSAPAPKPETAAPAPKPEAAASAPKPEAAASASKPQAAPARVARSAPERAAPPPVTTYPQLH